MKFVTSNQLKKYIDTNINDIDIFSYYMDIPATDIYQCINDRNKRVNNTLRTDNDPSYGFQYININGKYKLYGKDFANPFYTGDKYNIAGISLKLNANNKSDFVTICKDIIKVFNGGANSAVIPEKEKKQKVYTLNKVFKIDIEKRDWEYNDIKYFWDQGIKLESLKQEKVYPVKAFRLLKFGNNNEQEYTYDVLDPAYAYYIGRDKYDLWEIYRPYANKYFKFRTNNNKDLKELYEIQPNDNLIITKSKKEKILFKQILKEYDITDTDVKYTTESSRFRKATRMLLSDNYKRIFINFDIDKAGIDAMTYFNGEYGYELFPFVLDDILKLNDIPKDATDFCKLYGYKATKQLFKILYNKYIKL